MEQDKQAFISPWLMLCIWILVILFVVLGMTVNIRNQHWDVYSVAFFPVGMTSLGLLLFSLSLALIYSRKHILEHQMSLLDKEENYRLLVENLSAGILICGADSSIRFANPEATRLLGMSGEEMKEKQISMLMWKLVDEKGIPLLRENYPVSQVISSGKSVHHVMAGIIPVNAVKTCWMMFSAYPRFIAQGKLLHVVVTFVDLTERKLAEERAKLLQYRSEAMLKMPQKMDLMDEKEFMQYSQEVAEELTGSQIAFLHFANSDEQTINLITWSRRTMERYCHVATYQSHYPLKQAGIWADAMRERAPVIINDYAAYPRKHGLPEGHSVLTRLLSVPIFENDKVVMLMGVGNKAQDYNDFDVETVQLIGNDVWRLVQLKRSLVALRASEARFRELIKLLPVPLAMSDTNGNITYLNEAFSKLFGYTLGDIKTLDEWWLPSDPDVSREQEKMPTWKQHVIKEESSNHRFTTMDVCVRCKDGGIRVVLVAAMLTNDLIRDMYVISFFDITERKQAEESMKYNLKEMSRFNAIAVNREERMIELKGEINELLREAGEAERYRIPR
jgi:two-component system, sensor histidine kinase and response regulator